MKRILDLIIVIILIIIFLLPIIIIFLILKFFYNTKPIYISKRIGKNNKIFLMPKFRTMLEGAPQVATDKINPKYVTKFGKFLRKSSLDELPQLFSVLLGVMSFVGPRPALFNQKKLISLRTKKNIHKLKPGITGWAQINGRDKISIYKKVTLDYFYYNNLTIKLDIKIILLTVVRVFNYKNVLH
jgi:O-antigen biosynthesis protein WbqP